MSLFSHHLPQTFTICHCFLTIYHIYHMSMFSHHLYLIYTFYHCHLTLWTGQYPQQAHYFYYNGQHLPIIIEDSNRISNLITNRILKILLEVWYHHVPLMSDFLPLFSHRMLFRVTLFFIMTSYAELIKTLPHCLPSILKIVHI